MNYFEVERAIANNQPFTHNGTMTGVYMAGGSHDQYVVYSYATEIYRCDCDGVKSWNHRLNRKKYSQTTTGQQNLIRRAKGIE